MLTLVAMMVTLGLTAVGPAEAASQFTLFDATDSQTASSYFDPAFNSPSNWKSPTNYAAGRMYWRLEILSKPSAKSVDVQVCMWRHGSRKWQFETCSSRLRGITKAGTYWANLGAPQNWWKKNGAWDFTKRPSVVRVMVKDSATQKLLMTSHCGSACYRGGDIGQHVPIKMNSQAIVVAQGATLQPPAKWVPECPDAWSPAC